MENASKALIMAGSMLIALLIIGALFLVFNNLSKYQETNIEIDRESQIIEFNNQYDTYDREKIRGTDLLSLVNKVVDYNARKTGDTSDEKYEKMKIDIVGINVDLFKYNINQNRDLDLIKSTYNQDNVQTALINKVKNIENTYQLQYITKLVSEIHNIMDVDKGEEKAKEILKKNLTGFGGINIIREQTQIYYQYAQFKKSYFKCVDTKYNPNTGRIIYMKFEFTKIGD